MCSVIPITYFTHPSAPSPLVTISLLPIVKSLFLGLSLFRMHFFCFCFSLCSFLLFLKFHIWERWYGICVSVTGLFRLALYYPHPSVLLQMAIFHSFLWLNNIPLCVCAHTHIASLSIHLLMDTWAASIVYVVNNKAINIGAHMSLCISVFVFCG